MITGHFIRQNNVPLRCLCSNPHALHGRWDWDQGSCLGGYPGLRRGAESNARRPSSLKCREVQCVCLTHHSWLWRWRKGPWIKEHSGHSGTRPALRLQGPLSHSHKEADSANSLNEQGTQKGTQPCAYWSPGLWKDTNSVELISWWWFVIAVTGHQLGCLFVSVNLTKRWYQPWLPQGPPVTWPEPREKQWCDISRDVGPQAAFETSHDTAPWLGHLYIYRNSQNYGVTEEGPSKFWQLSDVGTQLAKQNWAPERRGLDL